MTWAQQEQVTHFLLSISPTNEPSVRVATKLGFHPIGAHLDDENGLEYMYERHFAP